MHARSTSITIPMDKLDAWEQSVERLKSRLEQMQGYEGGYFMIDRKTGKALVVNLFDSEQSLRNSRDASKRLRSEAWNQIGLTGNTPDFDEYEVVLEVAGRRRKAA